MVVTNRSSGHPSIEIFEGKELPEVFEAVANWLRFHQVSVLAISVAPMEEGESVIVCYEF